MKNIDNINYHYKIVYTLDKDLNYHYTVKKSTKGRSRLLFDSTSDNKKKLEKLPFEMQAVRIDWIIKHVTNANKYPPRMSKDGHYLLGRFDLQKPRLGDRSYAVRTVHYELFKTMLKLIVTNIEDKKNSSNKDPYTIAIEVEYSTIIERARLDNGNTIVTDIGIQLYRQFTYLEYFFDRFITIRETLQAQSFTSKLAIFSIAGTAIVTALLDKDSILYSLLCNLL